MLRITSYLYYKLGSLVKSDYHGMTVPKGYMSTYGISKASGRPNPAVVPCHSAIDSNGSLRYAFRTAMKIKLLRMEVGAQNIFKKS